MTMSDAAFTLTRVRLWVSVYRLYGKHEFAAVHIDMRNNSVYWDTYLYTRVTECQGMGVRGIG